jgi:hypothetical protein
MTAGTLLRLYPRPWRERYGEEFLEMVGPGRLQLQQVIDIVSGAIDARLSSDVRGVTRVAAQPSGVTTMMKFVSICAKNQTRYTTRDGAIGAAVMLIGTLLLTLAATALSRSGFRPAGEMLLNSGFLIALMASMPFWLMKDQPRKAQAVIIGSTIAMLLLINSVAVLIN